MNRREFLSTLSMGAMSFNNMISEEEPTTLETITYVRNPDLPTVRDGYAGAPVRNGRFLNENLKGSDKSFGSVLKWLLTSNPQKEEKQNDPFHLGVETLENLDDLPGNSLVWLGHASFMIRIGDRLIVTDPCLTHPPMSQRLAALPITAEQCEAIDYILISHGHYDHLDSTSLGFFKSRFTQALLPLRMARVMESLNKYISLHEASWYQRYSLHEDFQVTFLPAQHWHLRLPWDRNRVLWGSFLIETQDVKIFFAGDTGYAGHFKDIYDVFGAIDYCLLPIGAYRPAYIMKENHMNPEEAVQAFHDLHGRVLIPMHYGTFDLADEPLGEPLRWLRSLEAQGKIAGEVNIPDVGEIVSIETRVPSKAPGKERKGQM